VTVVNLVCEDSIERGILHLLAQKQALADGVLDGSGDLGALKMPSGRAAMIERMQAMMQAAGTAAPRIVSADEAIAEELQRRHGERALLIETRRAGDGRVRMLAVLDLDCDAIAAEAKRLAAAENGGPVVEVIDRTTWLVMRRLQSIGMLQLVEGPVRVLHCALQPAEVGSQSGDAAARSAELRGQAERTLRMARVLATGGFPEEAPPLLAKAIGHAAAAKLAARGELPDGISMVTSGQMRDLVDRGALPPPFLNTLAALWPASGAPSREEAGHLVETTAELLAACEDGTDAESSSAPLLRVQARPHPSAASGMSAFNS
jgi:hypothetical protein